jgi:chemosensory pili system protein ChpA (sensor histidine kinase/response regulator)
MMPMTIITNRLYRTVRETAAKVGKQVRLVIQGENIELDRMVWEKLSDPLMHLLRNAVDHGIEPPELRHSLGKPPVGTVKVAASYQGNQVAIRIKDDGRGLDYTAIRKKARLAGSADKLDERSKEELAALIFQPGFSTRRGVNEVSGRGVGLDVVKGNITELKGTVRVAESQDGQGAQFYLRIPLTLAVVRALLFRVGGRLYAIALSEIKEILRIHPNNIVHQPQEAVRIDDTLIPLYYLSDVLNIQANEVDSLAAAEHPLTLVIDTGDWLGAVVIDTLYGQREIVIKNIGSHLRHVKGISGATVMGDGKVVPILNMEELCSSGKSINDAILSEVQPEIGKPLEIMVVDDSVSIRQVVSRLMENQGWKVLTAKDGIDALDRLGESRPDLIVLDIEMPRMNGFEFLGALKAQVGFEDIPVVMLTSRTATKHRVKAKALGAKGFVVKPYKDDDFINLILQLTTESKKEKKRKNG